MWIGIGILVELTVIIAACGISMVVTTEGGWRVASGILTIAAIALIWSMWEVWV